MYEYSKFKTVIRADDGSDKKVSVKQNTSSQTVKITVEGTGEELFATMAQMEVMKKKYVIVPAGKSATIEIQNSHPTVLFAGRFELMKPLISTSWNTLFDSTVFKPK